MKSSASSAILQQRTAGVLLHISSLPSIHGIGDLGTEATSYADWLSSAGFTLWQVLPLVPAGDGNSPYCSLAAFAGNPLFISLEKLLEWKLLKDADLENPPLFNLERVEFSSVAEYKMPLILKAAKAFIKNPKHPLHKNFLNYKKNEAQWLDDATLFQLLREENANKRWWLWKKDIRDRDPKALAAARTRLASKLEEQKAIQFFFDEQWRLLKSYCTSKNITLVGDIPIYVGGDSADVWAHRHLFKVSSDGQATKVAGCPPDAFSQTGQFWGNPVYNWKEHKRTGFDWWIRRVRRALQHTELVRIDHFRGLAAYWEIPATDKDARGGQWVEGPSHDFINAMHKALGHLPFIAEDLGYIDEPVIRLRDDHNLPGMMILQFAFGDRNTNEHSLHAAKPNRIMYPGTHDNETLLGWWENLSENARTHSRSYLGLSLSDKHDVAHAVIRATLASIANHAIVPMQDILGLNNSARMNTPGTEGPQNWSWRMSAGTNGTHLAAKYLSLNSLFGRYSNKN
jgi:4-alpha-glucanotransferase